MLRKYRLETSRCFSKTIHVSMQSASIVRISKVFLTALTSILTGSVYGLISLRPNKADNWSWFKTIKHMVVIWNQGDRDSEGGNNGTEESKVNLAEQPCGTFL